ncbi:MAG: hypothetical protein KGJ13_05225 [Patescibacteria group bacterium]|nr:hypothetical protein [Patescibacteria group bacterium]
MFDDLIDAISPQTFVSFIPTTGTWAHKSKVIARDVVYGALGLFVLDVSWRLMDLGIDFICNHISWLHWLAD